MIAVGVSPLIAIGWSMAIPAFNHIKRLLWLNQTAFPIRGIAFPNRFIDELHGIPVLELDEVVAIHASAPISLVCLTTNQSVKELAERTFVPRGIPCLSADAFLREHVARHGWAELATPFPTIPLTAFGAGDASPCVSLVERLSDRSSATLYAELARAFAGIDLTAFFDLGERITPDLLFADLLDGYVRDGVRDFVMTAGDVALGTDILLQTASGYDSAGMSLTVTRLRSLGPRATLYRDVLGDRLRTEITPGMAIGAVISDAPTEWLQCATEHMSAIRQAHAIIRLPGSLVDLHTLAEFLERHDLGHRVRLRQVSVDPSMLYAILIPT
jgi:hypothetical protein